MKKLIFIIAATAIFFTACDKVSNPIVPKVVVIGSNFVKNDNSSVAGFKKVLLEDYTGQTCPNCPTAAKVIANDLLPTYGNSLVVIAVHQGDVYAKPAGTYTNDFRTTAGEEWGSKSGSFPVNFYPCGLINRKNFGTGVLTANQSWPSIIPKALADPFVVKLDVNTEYDTVARALNVKVQGTFQTAYSNPLMIVAVYIEDSISGKQKDGKLEIEEYEFEHMMRGDIIGTWGKPFTTGASAAGAIVNWSNDNFGLPRVPTGISNTQNMAPINDHKVSVVVFVYDATDKSVIQVEKVKIRPSVSKI